LNSADIRDNHEKGRDKRCNEQRAARRSSCRAAISKKTEKRKENLT